jgi:hypothetical protein|tara:strand:+ start:195 stop:1196 length:1002 start_codon:yes stop_codon:yes gene_type:complete
MNKDVYGDEVIHSSDTGYKNTPEDIARHNKSMKDNELMTKRVLKTEPSVDSILKTPSNISPVETRLLTNEVESARVDYAKKDSVVAKIRKSNVLNFYKQINHNLGIGAKALYLVCRDLHSAKHKLTAEDYAILQKTLPLSESTISKYIRIAESDVCKKLYLKGTLPEGWTTMYEIAKVEEIKVKEKLIKNVNSNSTLDQIWKMIGKVFKTLPPKFVFDMVKPKEFLKVAFESGKEFAGDSTTIGQVDPIALLMVKEKVEVAVKEAMKEYSEKYPTEYNLNNPAEVEVSLHNEIVEQSKKSLISYFTKDKKKGDESVFHYKWAEFNGEKTNAIA